MINVAAKFPKMFDQNDDLSRAGQLFTEAASLSPKYDFKKQDVVLMALPETDKLWVEVVEECFVQKVNMIIPPKHKDVARIAQSIIEEQVSVLIVSSVLWPAVFQALNTRPAYNTRMQVIISDGKGNIETRFSLISDTSPRV